MKNNKKPLTPIEIALMIGVGLLSITVALAATYLLNLITK
tara:strand:- start:546 stop:665 length:120 start_codon:yes stop_codon:yes gene_type:complete